MQRFIVGIALASLALTCCCCAAPSDQYPSVKTPKSRHRFDLQRTAKDRSKNNDNDVVPDLQVGCGDGLLVERTTTSKPVPEKKKQVLKGRRRREAGANGRKPRSYYAYTIYTPASVSYSTVFRSKPYRISRPYYIPVLGSHGRLPIYFPPQPVNVNPGFPIDNPPSKGYLPPDQPISPPTTPETPEMDIFDRFGGPVWDSSPVRPPASSNQAPAGPTRRPNLPKTSTFPPLIHSLDSSTTSAPIPPPRAPLEENEIEPSAAAAAPLPPSSPQPNQCAFAIINCCSGASKDVRGSCFERLGCPGPFWDRSPCESDFARRAVEYALNYYQ